MGKTQLKQITQDHLSGLKYFKKLRGLLQHLHSHATARDRAHNRTLHYDQYLCLILLHLFNPISQGLRSISQCSALPKVQKKLGVKYVSLGSLSEAARVFDPQLLQGVIQTLGKQLTPLSHDPRLSQIKQVLTLVDGTVLKALPRIAEAMWLTNGSGNAQHAWRLHTHFELLKAIPATMCLTDAKNSGDSSERTVLALSLQPDRCYVIDRGFVKFELFNQIVDAGSSYVCRLREDTLLQDVQQRSLSKEAIEAGVVQDLSVKLGATGKGAKPSAQTQHPVRVIALSITPHVRRGGRKGDCAGPANRGRLLIATSLGPEVPAEVIALIYRHRWAIEIFFRFFKQTLGCRHLISDSPQGVRIQSYCAMIACMLINLYGNRRCDRRTWEMCCYFMSDLASEADLVAFLDKPDRTGVKLAAKAALWQKLGY